MVMERLMTIFLQTNCTTNLEMTTMVKVLARMPARQRLVTRTPCTDNLQGPSDLRLTSM